MGYSPRVRAKKETPTIRNCLPTKDAVALGFLAYKAGMTHVIAKNLDKNSPTHGMDVQLPVTILDCPPVVVFGIRAYIKGYKRFEVLVDVLAEKFDKELTRAMCVPKDSKNAEDMKKVEEALDRIVEFALLTHTQPKKSGMKKKIPDIIEIPIGGDVKAQWAYAKKMLGKELDIKDVFAETDSLDAIAVTKGKGFQGPVKRWGVKMQKRKHKRGGHCRHVGAIGLRGYHKLSGRVPAAGRMGYHRRTELNKLILRIGDKGAEIMPKGGIVNYGLVPGAYILIKGSIPGPAKRAIALRKSLRVLRKKPGFAVESVSIESKQGI